MDVLSADQKIDTGDGQHDGEQDDSRGRCVAGIATGGAVEHIVDIAYNGVHFRGIQVGAEQGHCIGIGLERTDETGDDQVKKSRGDHGQGNFGEYPQPGGAVHLGCVIVGLVYGGQRRGQNQNFEWHDYPNGIEAQYKHLCPVRAAAKVNGTCAEPAKDQICQTVGIGGLLEENHKYQTHCQRVCDIGQEVDRLKGIPKLLDRA